jgi:hypothetical protein
VNLSFLQEFKQSLYFTTHTNFENKALALFNYQAVYNPVYAEYLSYLHISPGQIRTLHQIPFLPIEFFKTRQVISGELPVTTVLKAAVLPANCPANTL